MGSKVLHLLSLLPQRPAEFCDRVADFAGARFELIRQSRPEYSAVSFADGISAVLGNKSSNPGAILGERDLANLEEQLKERKARLGADAPFKEAHNGDALLGRLCYAVARVIRPKVAAETGVCYGVTSAYLLAALEVNGHGRLHSIDLPPLARKGDDFVGWLVPRELRHRWSLQRGTSARLLGPLVKNLGSLDLFVHDSLHTYRNMKEEFETAWRALRGGGVLISDDIQGNEAFLELARSEDVSLSAVIQEKNKDALLGVAVKRK